MEARWAHITSLMEPSGPRIETESRYNFLPFVPTHKCDALLSDYLYVGERM